MPQDLDHILEQGGSASPTYLMSLLLSKILSVQVRGSNATVGGNSVRLAPDGETFRGLAADRPTAADAHAAVPFAYYESVDTGAIDQTDGTNWVAVV